MLYFSGFPQHQKGDIRFVLLITITINSKTRRKYCPNYIGNALFSCSRKANYPLHLPEKEEAERGWWKIQENPDSGLHSNSDHRKKIYSFYLRIFVCQHAQTQLAFINTNSKAGFYTFTSTLGFINGLQRAATACTVSLHNRSYSALLEGPINDVHKQWDLNR